MEVAQAVRGQTGDAGFPADAVEGADDCPLLQRLPVGPAEDQVEVSPGRSCPQAPLGDQGALLAEEGQTGRPDGDHSPPSSRLGRRLDPGTGDVLAGPLDAHRPRRPVDVRPAERQRLTEPTAGHQQEPDQWRTGVGRVQTVLDEPPDGVQVGENRSAGGVARWPHPVARVGTEPSHRLGPAEAAVQEAVDVAGGALTRQPVQEALESVGGELGQRDPTELRLDVSTVQVAVVGQRPRFPATLLGLQPAFHQLADSQSSGRRGLVEHQPSLELGQLAADLVFRPTAD